MPSPLRALVLAAGRGMRLRPLTLERPKPLLPVLGRPLVSYTLERLAALGIDLKAARAGKLDPVIGRDTEIRSVIRILSRKTKNNPVLIGEPGVGKTAIVEGLAQRIVAGEVPDSLRDKRVLSLDMAALLAGAAATAQAEDKFVTIGTGGPQ